MPVADAGIPELALALAKKVTVPRLAFRQAYDDVLGRYANPGLPRNFLLTQTTAGSLLPAGFAVPDPTVDADAFLLALVALRETAAFLNIVSELVGEEVFYPAGADAETRKRVRMEIGRQLSENLGPQQPASPATPGPPVEGKPEAILDPHSSWVQAERVSPSVMLALRRVCRIVAPGADGKPISGTGFLIGPSAVLTNFHVVEHLPTDRPLAKDALRISFDGHASKPQTGTPALPRAENWLLAHSTLGPKDPAGPANVAGWWMDDAARDAFLATLRGHLDFAVIALVSAPGDQRGWYDLSQEMSEPAGTCSVFHHPGGLAMADSTGSIVASSKDHPNRVFHGATTHGGSSGGLMLNADGEPVALHNSSYQPAAALPGGRDPVFPQEIVNAAVPLATIARSIGTDALKTIGESRRISVPFGCIDGNRPVFGREDLLAALKDLVEGRHRILWIKPPVVAARRCGKSFSAKVMEALLPGNIYIKITPDLVKSDGRAMAAFLLERLQTGLSAALPQSTNAGTTEAAFFPDQLLPEFFQHIATAAGRRGVWLIIDDLGIMDLPDSGGRRLLDVLYKRVSECPPLRIVLIGLKYDLPVIPQEILRINQIEEWETREAARMFCQWLALHGERDKAIADDVKNMLGAMVQSYVGEGAILQRMSEFSRDHLIRPLAALFRPEKP